MNYIAFLRGINLGSTHKVPMRDLKESFESIGFTNVKTSLNSGNVIFTADEADVSHVQNIIGNHLEKTFGFPINTLIRTQKEVQEMVEENPFKNITMTAQTRLYVTFLSESSKSALKIPYESPEKNFRILRVSNNAIFSVLLLSGKYNTTDAMNIIGKEFGKNVTTRNWNTVVKMAK